MNPSELRLPVESGEDSRLATAVIIEHWRSHRRPPEPTEIYSWGVPPLSARWSFAYILANLRTALPLAVADQLGMVLGLTLAHLTVHASSAQAPFPFGLTLGLGCGLFAAFLAARLYPGVGIPTTSESLRCVTAVSGVFVLYLIASSVFGADGRHELTLAGAWLLTLSFVPLLRYATRNLFARYSWWRQPVLPLDHDADGDVQAFAEELIRRPQLGLTPVVLPVDLFAAHDSRQSGSHARVATSLDEQVRELVGQFRIYRAIIPHTNAAGVSGNRLMESCSSWFPHLLLVTPVSRPDLPLSPLNVWSLGDFTVTEYWSRLRSPLAYLVKRAFDIIVSLLTLMILSPMLVVIAVLVRCSSHGRAVYGQERIGRGGRPFRIWKFRTMYHDAEEILEEYLNHHPELRSEWEEQMKLSRDPRVVPYVGTFLRKTSLDEIPQLWNVVRGEMSLVGPRPLPVYHLEKFDRQFCEHRERVLPGITGMWQVSSRGNGQLESYIACDDFYIRNWSLWLDLALLARTIKAVVTGRGAS